MKTALVTGGARRIGAAIAAELARNGFNVAIQFASSENEAEQLAERLRAFGVDVVALEANLLEQDDCKALFAQAREALGPLDLLVNNASIFEDDDAEAFDSDRFDKHVAIHLKAPSILASAMVAQQDVSNGLIINMIDQRVWSLTPKFYSYTLSKSALWTATKTMAQQFAPRFRVNAIGPGPTLANERQDPSDFQKQIDGLLLKKGPELSDFGDTIRYLYGMQSITGQMIALDGGQHLAWETPDVAGIKE